MNIEGLKLTRKLFGKLLGRGPDLERLMYRRELFDELRALQPDTMFRGTRILEIGPRDGLDSARLASLSPSELVMIELPEKTAKVQDWIENLTCPKRYIESNFMYMPQDELSSLGAFDLIWCTGVLYHNAEQLRFLRKLYRLLKVGGVLVLETATLRLSRKLALMPLVEIHYPDTYRNTGTITHLPSRGAVKAWLAMAGFKNIRDSNCYRRYNRELMRQRFACISTKAESDGAGVYYARTGLNPEYRFGDAV